MAPNIDSEILSIPPLIFTGAANKCKIWYLKPCPLVSKWSNIKRNYCSLSLAVLLSSQIWSTSVHPTTLRTKIYKFTTQKYLSYVFLDFAEIWYICSFQGAAQWLKFTYLESQDGGWPPNFQSLNRYNYSAKNSSISLK